MLNLCIVIITVLYLNAMCRDVVIANLGVLPKAGGPRPTARQGPAARGPRPSPDFPKSFVQRKLHAHAPICIGFGCATWTTVSLNSFTILIISLILFDPFFRCLLLSEKRRHSLFIRLLTEPDREELHCQTIQMI